MSGARIAALEKRLADVEKRHAEAIAWIALAIDDLVHMPEMGTQNVEPFVEKVHMRVAELVRAAYDRASARYCEALDGRGNAADAVPVKLSAKAGAAA